MDFVSVDDEAGYHRGTGEGVEAVDYCGRHEGELALDGTGGNGDVEGVALDPSSRSEAVDGRPDGLRPQIADAVGIVGGRTARCFDKAAYQLAHLYGVATFHRL